MRTFIGLLLIVLGFASLMGGVGVFGLVLMVGGVTVMATGRSVPEEDESPRIPLPSERREQSLVEERPRVAALPSARTVQTNDSPDVAALRAAVETLSKRQNTLERSRKLQKATARIQHLEREVDRLRRRLERLDPTPDAQTALDLTARETTQTDDPSAVDALARLLDRT